MNRYVIVCLFKDDVLKFHEKLVNDVCYEFNVKKQKLPAHFTIKAPFETDNIEEIEKITEEFVKNNNKQNIKISGFDKFRTDVVFMKVIPSKEALMVHDEFINNLKKVSWLKWKHHEGNDKNKVFHCTIVSRLKEDKFYPIWEYVNKYNLQFETHFDNISILKWENNRWEVYKEYILK